MQNRNAPLTGRRTTTMLRKVTMRGETTFLVLGDTFAVFDPLGGPSADHAVAAARDAFRDSVRDHPQDLKRALVEANVAINEAVQAAPALRGIGCTAAALGLSTDVVTVAWAGDVHVLRLRGERLETLTREHSLQNEQARLGLVLPEDDESRGIRPSSVIVRALGMPTVDVDVTVESVEAGDLFVLISDGVRAALGDALLSSLILAHRGDVDEGLRALLENARANAAKDWLTVVIVRVDERGRPPVSAALSEAG